MKLGESIDEDKARSVLAGLSAPAGKDQIIEWLTICAIKTAHKKQDDMTSELKLKVFASELAKYPGDIVRHVLAEWPDKSKWFPEWFDLKTEIDSLSGIRPMIVERVRMKIGAGA